LDASETVTLIKKAYKHGNVPDVLLVKGPIDYIVKKGEIVEIVDEPSIPALEAIGGTGDSLTGILSALIYAGKEKIEACIKAARINRIAGKLANPDPATSILGMITKIKDALKEAKLCA
jgi:NAD(P)H-hydrate repair Nnr-like enzyme with NAD(P)H-hydrate dehydratase domain